MTSVKVTYTAELHTWIFHVDGVADESASPVGCSIASVSTGKLLVEALVRRLAPTAEISWQLGGLGPYQRLAESSDEAIENLYEALRTLRASDKASGDGRTFWHGDFRVQAEVIELLLRQRQRNFAPIAWD